ncbi:MAG: hypothetical protein ACYC10_11695 [Allorhizobium sp.]
MSRGYRVYIIAFGLIVLAISGQAQDQPYQADRSGGAEQSEPYTLPFSVPVKIVEEDAEANARQRQEAEAGEREKRDLVAQEGMNAATQEINAATQAMAAYAYWSTVLVGVGTVLLFVTLFLTMQATRAARDAVSVTREIGEAQTRAYLEFHEVSATVTDDGSAILIKGSVLNSGNSPAVGATVQLKWHVAASQVFDEKLWDSMPAAISRQSIGAGRSAFLHVMTNDGLNPHEKLNASHVEKICNGQIHFWVLIVTKYVDVFGNKRASYYRSRLVTVGVPSGERRISLAIEDAKRENT